MEEVFEDNLAPQMPHSKRGKQFQARRVKTPLIAAPSPSPTPVAFKPLAGEAVLPPARRSHAAAGSAIPGADSSGLKGKGQQPPLPQHKHKRVQQLPPVKAAWARAGPDDGGENAIKAALALLNTGGLAALPGLIAVSPAPAAPGLRETPSAGSRLPPTANTVKAPAVTETVEEPEEEEEEGGEEEKGSGGEEKLSDVMGAAASGKGSDGGAEGAGGVVDEEEDDEDDEDDDDEDEGVLYDDDDDDPYGEEA